MKIREKLGFFPKNKQNSNKTRIENYLNFKFHSCKLRQHYVMAKRTKNGTE